MLLRLAFRSRCSRSRHLSAWQFCLTRYKHHSVAHSRKCETVSLKVGGNGFVDINIIKPLHLTSNNKILVHLPPGPTPEANVPSPWTSLDARELSVSFPDATIIDLQYRLAPRDTSTELDHRFPTPIHDVSKAWDYIVDREAPHNQITEHGKDVFKESKICLVGSGVGGALALTLALTNPEAIHAVAVTEPMVDWVGLDELAANNEGVGRSKRETTKSKQVPDMRDEVISAAKALIKLRTSLFRTPSAYFDAFASPVLFLRAPGRDIPLTKTAAPTDNLEHFVAGTPIRYGEEEDDVGLIEYESAQHAFGPYDDDHWHALETVRTREREYRHDVSDSNDTVSSRDSSANTALSSQSTHSSHKTHLESESHIMASQPRRRKVLRRWPPIVDPEEVMLPYIRIVLSKQQSLEDHDSNKVRQTGISSVTRLQGIELLDLLRKACFWGREKNLAEERVTLEELDPVEAASQRRVVEWLQAQFEESDVA